MKLSRRKMELMLVDIAIIICVYYMTNLVKVLRLHSIVLNGEINLSRMLALVVTIMAGRIVFGVYRNIWRYANIQTYLTIMVSDFVSNVLLMLLGRVWFAVNLGIGVHLIVAMAILLVTLLSRYCYQLLYAYRNRNADKNIEGNAFSQLYKVEVAIVGAGNVGATLSDEFFRNPRSRYEPVCFIDTDPEKVGQTVNGVPVYPEDDSTANLLKRMKVREIIIALPDLTVERKQKLYERYQDTGCAVKVYDYPSGTEEKSTAKRALRDFRIEDLLFRDTIQVENSQTMAFYGGKTVLVTGGGGSIGSELCRQVMRFKPGKLLIFDIYENCAYELQMELQQKYGRDIPVTVLIGSIRDKKRLDEVFDTYHPTVVFHAAAHKHVPLMEVSPAEAVKNNVLGTKNLLVSASEHGVERFVQLSTDKAVNPTSVMGCTKRICEMLIQTFAGNTDMKCVAVRFGNVLGSHGSVIPLFEAQIKKGGPVTLTDPNIVRYFMTIPEAAQLVLQAGALAESGNIYVLDMGEPVKIMDLAKQLIRFYGYEPGVNMEIKIVGLRPGEKLYEELMMDEEQGKMRRTEHNKIFVASPRDIDLAVFYQQLQDLAAAAQHNDEGVVDQLEKMIPTFTPTRKNLKV